MFDGVKKSLGRVLSDIGIDDRTDITLLIADTEFKVLSARVFRSINNCADGCSATLVFTDEVRQKIKPFGYEDAQVYVAGELVITGRVYAIEPKITSEEKTIEISIYSLACDILDSVKYPPYEFKMASLEYLANQLIGELGIQVDFSSDLGSQFFERVCIDPQQSIFDFLSDLAKQHGILITSNQKGEVMFIRANTKSKPVETISNVTNISGSFDGRRLYSIYRATAMSPAREGKTKKFNRGATKETKRTVKFAEAYDVLIPLNRYYLFRADNTTVDDLGTAASWERSKRWAGALSIRVPRVGWFPSGKEEIYKENTMITVKSDDLWMNKGFDFLISSVEYLLNGSEATCTLGLVPPQAFTGEEIPDVFGGGISTNNLLKSIGL